MRKVKCIILAIFVMLFSSCNFAFNTREIVAPEISYDYENAIVSIKCESTQKVDIYYSVDGSDPDRNSILYTGPFRISSDSCIKAAAFMVFPEEARSEVVTFNIELPEVATPKVYYTPVEGGFSLSIQACDGYKVFYTVDGSDPITNKDGRNEYVPGIVLPQDTVLKVVAFYGGAYSECLEVTLLYEKVDDPVIRNISKSPFLGIIDMSGEGKGIIYYTLDGTDPRTSSTRLPYQEKLNLSSSAVVKACLLKDYAVSDCVELKVDIAGGPEITVISETDKTKTFEMKTVEGCSISYTLDGSDPVVNGMEYTEPIKIEHNCFLKTVARYEDTYSVMTEMEILLYVTPPEILMEDDFNGGKLITLKIDDSQQIYYTLDNTDPSTSSSARIYETPFKVDESCTVKAVSFRSGMYSDVRSKYIKIVKEYKVGDVGPAGGIIVYDCDLDNESGNNDCIDSETCGWRYMEAATSPLKIVDGVLTCDSSLPRYSAFPVYMPFGYYAKNYFNVIYVNGTEKHTLEDCTRPEIGEGLSNTVLHLKTMGLKYCWLNEDKNSYRLAESNPVILCSEYSVCNDGVIYDDWFMPSISELEQVIKVIGPVNYDVWSSSESRYRPDCQLFWYATDGCIAQRSRGSLGAIIPVRVFSNDIPAPSMEYKDDYISIHSVDSNAKIYYSDSGRDPKTNGTLYREPIRPSYDRDIVVRAYAVTDEGDSSPENILLKYNRVQLDPPSFKVTTNKDVVRQVSMESNYPYACIRYTVDGSEVTENSLVYESAFEVPAGTRVRAKVYSACVDPSVEINEVVRTVGDIGPAGGIIFYDSGMERADGWRYLEAAPGELRCFDGKLSIDPHEAGYGSGKRDFIFGAYQDAGDSEPLYTSGDSHYYSDYVKTGGAVGDGNPNTAALLSCMKFQCSYGKKGRDAYNLPYSVPFLVSILESENDGEVFNDWFIPSSMELDVLNKFIKTPNAWTSTESSTGPEFLIFYDRYAKYSKASRYEAHHVWPIRAFSDKNPKCPSFTTEINMAHGYKAVTSISHEKDNAAIYYGYDYPDDMWVAHSYNGPITTNWVSLVSARAFVPGQEKNSTTTYKLVGEELILPTPEIRIQKLGEGESVIEISSAFEGAVIRYTIDGGDPDCNSPVYEGELQVAQGTVVKARAFFKGLLDSCIASLRI